jgi:Asp/Glu/hydantoin racemase
VAALMCRQRAGKIGVVTTKERLHKLVDELSEPEADDALRYIAARRDDPLVAAFDDAPEDEELFTDEDREALAEVQADRAAGVPTIPLEEIKRKHGSA